MLVVVPGKIFHSFDKVLYGCGPVATCAGRRVWNVEARHHFTHLVRLQVQESLDQVAVNETLREKNSKMKSSIIPYYTSKKRAARG